MFSLFLTGALLCGFVLGHVFRALVLVPTTLAMVVASVSVASYLGYEPWFVLLAQAATVTMLQLGYLLGVGSREMMKRVWTFLSAPLAQRAAQARDTWIAGRR